MGAGRGRGARGGPGAAGRARAPRGGPPPRPGLDCGPQRQGPRLPLAHRGALPGGRAALRVPARRPPAARLRPPAPPGGARRLRPRRPRRRRGRGGQRGVLPRGGGGERPEPRLGREPRGRVLDPGRPRPHRHLHPAGDPSPRQALRRRRVARRGARHPAPPAGGQGARRPRPGLQPHVDAPRGAPRREPAAHRGARGARRPEDARGAARGSARHPGRHRRRLRPSRLATR